MSMCHEPCPGWRGGWSRGEQLAKVVGWESRCCILGRKAQWGWGLVSEMKSGEMGVQLNTGGSIPRVPWVCPCKILTSLLGEESLQLGSLCLDSLSAPRLRTESPVWEKRHLLETVNYQEGNKKWYVPGIPLHLWECIPVLICETTCQGPWCQFSVLPETLPSLGPHDSCLSWFPPMLSFSTLSPSQAHSCPPGFGMMGALKDQLPFH